MYRYPSENAGKPNAVVISQIYVNLSGNILLVEDVDKIYRETKIITSPVPKVDEHTLMACYAIGISRIAASFVNKTYAYDRQYLTGVLKQMHDRLHIPVQLARKCDTKICVAKVVYGSPTKKARLVLDYNNLWSEDKKEKQMLDALGDTILYRLQKAYPEHDELEEAFKAIESNIIKDFDDYHSALVKKEKYEREGIHNNGLAYLKY